MRLCLVLLFDSMELVKLKPFKLAPGLIAFAVIAVVSLIRCLQPDFFERLEKMTYDVRARQALRFSPTVATNLGFVFIDEESVRKVRDHSLGFRFGLYWPRQVYGRLVNELSAQGTTAVAFDILFGELRPDHASVSLANGTYIESDDFFAREMHRAGNVIIATTKEVIPPLLFATNALAMGDITTEKDSDGILRRVQIFRTYTNWHWAFRQLEDDPDFGVVLDRARFEGNQLVFPRQGLDPIKIPLDKDGNFDLADLAGDKLPPGTARFSKPFTLEPVWHMGVVLAAQQLGLDLANAEVDLPDGRIVLRGPGTERVVPVDSNGYAYIDWCMPPNHPALTQDSIQNLLAQNKLRLEGQTEGLNNRWRGKLVVVGSSAIVGNNLTDRGATPLSEDTILVSKHWNVANSVLMGRFVQRSSLALDLLLIVAFGIVAALLSWYARMLSALTAVVALALGYVLFASQLYIHSRYWIPIVLPVGAMLMNYVFLATWRVVFEAAERRRVKSIFSTVVSPKIMDELLKAERLSLGGARREVTVLFADVRGFTELTDTNLERAGEFVRANKLVGAEAEACFDEEARRTLDTVNTYLGLVSNTIIQQDATLDKFIGDCVMAFWGAPTANPRHALACVRAAIEAQRAIYELNVQRSNENKQLELENLARVSAGLEPKPLLPLLLLGTGINTGMATVGLMGSETKTGVRHGNYTVFGREVNLASRLEGLSGRGRIFISESTYEQLRRQDAALASSCIAQPPQKVKGISTPVQVYEVPWRAPGSPPLEEEFAMTVKTDTTTITGFVQKPGG